MKEKLPVICFMAGLVSTGVGILGSCSYPDVNSMTKERIHRLVPTEVDSSAMEPVKETMYQIMETDDPWQTNRLKEKLSYQITHLPEPTIRQALLNDYYLSLTLSARYSKHAIKPDSTRTAYGVLALAGIPISYLGLGCLFRKSKNDQETI